MLSEITEWINNIPQDSQSQRVLLITGLAGSGKSTIAHTIASRFDVIKRLGASFAFDRQNKTRRVDQLFPHIARLVAGLGVPIQKALADIKALENEINQLVAEKNDRYSRVGNSRR